MALVGSPSSVLSKGIGSWGSVNLLLTRGLGVSTVAPSPISIPAVGYTSLTIPASGSTVLDIPAIGETSLSIPGISDYTGCI